MVDCGNLRCNWQAALNRTVEQQLNVLERLLPWLGNVHVFHWVNGDRRPLSEGYEEWKAYMDIIKNSEKLHYTMLEFVKDNNPEQFLQDALALKRLIEG
jgi:3-dehydroshikimate dehydratase